MPTQIATKKKPRNRAAQEATLINLRALKKRVAVLETSHDSHRRSLMALLGRLVKVEQWSHAHGKPK